ncbi:MAG: hypothetical protein ABJF04_07555 [Reichenbachiella sp.]|uniref:hypothetical protein n=1 Tax=Reichenbachiella sp. TaxID=2184521 RepID=UPI00326340D2
MEVESKMEINLEILKAEHFEPGFAVTFCDMVIAKLDEFKNDYKEYALSKNTDGIKSIVHELIATLRFLNLEEMCEVINRYQSIDLNDTFAIQELVKVVVDYCSQLEKALISFRQENSN